MKRTHVAALAALVLVATPALSGCWSGQAATTTTQATMNSGSGVDATQGPMHIEAAIVVTGPEGSNSATLTTRIVNTGAEADTLTFATINGKPATITGDTVEIAPGAGVSFGYLSDTWINTYDLGDVPSASYIPIQLGFQKAGLVDMSVLAVPPIGYYEGVAPQPATNPSAAAAESQASAAPEASASASAAPSPSASAG